MTNERIAIVAKELALLETDFEPVFSLFGVNNHHLANDLQLRLMRVSGPFRLCESGESRDLPD